NSIRKVDLTFIDLAGSERQHKSQITDSMRKESISINTNLLCLGNVINALYTQKKFIPFRSSTLTRILRPYFENSFIFFIGCISSSESDKGESIYTLEYANRAGNIRTKILNNNSDNNDDSEYKNYNNEHNNGNINHNMKTELLRLRDENAMLRREIHQLRALLQRNKIFSKQSSFQIENQENKNKEN
ncbi:Kinesin-like protein, partial [Pseudoloma neurophilia]